MDKTLIDCEFLDEVAKVKGCSDEVRLLTERGMCGEITFAESLKARLQLLKGLHINNFDKVFRESPMTEGAEELIRRLHAEGAKTAIITGGFDVVAHRHAHRLGMDYVACNKLEVRNGMLTGNFLLDVDGNKGQWLSRFKQASGATMSIAVGDGANDIPMIQEADLGVAFRAKECLRGIADVNVDNLLEIYNILDDIYDGTQRTCVNTSIEIISE
ncbi:MAG: phosphoserine phosphatase SerB [Candidatus Methanofastidiosa archaeon]|nr:phosphoserine phosphatase SerB [Candidatus Methanofastidiosa archaeon]